MFSVAQLCPTLYDSTDCSPSGSSVHGIFPAKILEWVAISFSRGFSRPRVELAFPASSALADGFFIICTSKDGFFTAPPGKPRR